MKSTSSFFFLFSFLFIITSCSDSTSLGEEIHSSQFESKSSSECLEEFENIPNCVFGIFSQNIDLPNLYPGCTFLIEAEY